MPAFRYYNPVRISFGPGAMDCLPSLVKGYRVLLVTTRGAVNRGILDHFAKVNLSAVIDDVQPNPSLKYLESKFAQLQTIEYDLVVAAGGGSVLDGAKAVSVNPVNKSFAALEGLIKDPEAGPYTLTPLVAIPTTAGTGSEVTPWATIWDMEHYRKFSLHLPDLWPEACICDSDLTLSMSWELTLYTGLDALSHSLEAIWNKNANPISTRYAITAAKAIIETLPLLREDLNNQALREVMMLAALRAGLAFSNTKTAIAHAISYYLTANKGISHGLACSFTLPYIIKVAMDQPELSLHLKEIFGDNPPETCRALLDGLQVATDVHAYMSPGELETIWQSLNPSRAGNSLVEIKKLYTILSGKE